MIMPQFSSVQNPMKTASSSTSQTHVLRGSSTTTIPKGNLGKEWSHTKQVSTTTRDMLPDGAIFIDIQWCRSTDTLSPTTKQIREYCESHMEAPVHIRFMQQTADKTSSNLWQNELAEYFDVFLKVLPRWKSVRLWAPYVPRQSFVGKVFPEAQLLEEVVIEGPPFFDVPVICQLLSPCWNGSHSLKIFELVSTVDNSIGSMMIIPRNYLPLDNLTQIQLCNKLSILECSEVLFHAPNLVECLFNNITGSSCVLRPIRCKHLQKLKLAANPEDFRSGTPINLRTLFESSKAPDLKHLDLAFITHWEDEHVSLTGFLQRSRCSLQALELDQIGITEHQLHSIFLLSPSLRILKVHGTPSHNPQQLPPRPTQSLTKNGYNRSTLCPQLEMLSINETVLHDFPDDTITNMLSGRNVKVFRFKPDQQRAQQNVQIAKMIENVKHRGNIIVLHEDIPASAEGWDEHVRRNVVVSSKLKNPDLSSLLGLILTGPPKAP